MPFPYIANEAGWIVSEVGRQPWIIYGLMRTAAGRLADGRERRNGLYADRLCRHVLCCSACCSCISCLREIATRPFARDAGGRPRYERRSRFVVIAFMLTMYVLLDGYDLGVAAIAPFDRAQRSRARSIDGKHRAVLERQRGVADCRRRRALRALSGGVRRRRSRDSICRSSSCCGC